MQSSWGAMLKRLEQVSAIVVAAGLAIVSYWLFFSWADGGGARQVPVPDQRERSAEQLIGPLHTWPVRMAAGVNGRTPWRATMGRWTPGQRPPRAFSTQRRVSGSGSCCTKALISSTERLI